MDRHDLPRGEATGELIDPGIPHEQPVRDHRHVDGSVRLGDGQRGELVGGDLCVADVQQLAAGEGHDEAEVLGAAVAGMHRERPNRRGADLERRGLVDGRREAVDAIAKAGSDRRSG